MQERKEFKRKKDVKFYVILVFAITLDYAVNSCTVYLLFYCATIQMWFSHRKSS